MKWRMRDFLRSKVIKSQEIRNYMFDVGDEALKTKVSLGFGFDVAEPNAKEKIGNFLSMLKMAGDKLEKVLEELENPNKEKNGAERQGNDEGGDLEEGK